MNSIAAMTEDSVARAGSNRRPRKLFARLLPLLALVCWTMFPASARAATISSGQSVTGTISSGTQVDTYTITPDINVGDGILASLGTDGTAGVELTATIKNSAGTSKCAGTTSNNPNSPFFTKCIVTTSGVTTGGAWTVNIKRWAGTSATGYRLTLIVIPAATAIPTNIAGDTTGGLMYPGVTYSGSVDRGDMQVWMANGVINKAGTVYITWTGGGTDSQAAIYVFHPNGTGGGGTYVDSIHPNSSLAFSEAGVPTGTSVFAILKNSGADGPVSYTLSTSGAGAAMPTDAKGDGAYCLPCQLAAQGYTVTNVGGAAAGDPVNNVGGAAAGDPINIATGNLFETAKDYTTAGQNPLQLIRYYNSQSYTRNITPTILGVNWRTNYDRYLLLDSSSLVAAERPDGQVINFSCNVTAHTCTPDPDMDYSLSYSGSTWTLTDPDDTVETYAASGSLGSLSSIRLRDGYTQAINYSSGQISYVSDSYGRQLGFTYTGSVVTGVTTPDPATLTYGYSTVGGQSLLSTVTYNTSPSTHISYLYENSGLPYALTGITDEDGNRFATWTYDGSNRALSSALGGLGANQTQISYSSAGNTVTGPLGIQDTYTFKSKLNLQKVIGISRAANGTVASAASSIAYDSNGYRNSLTDWNGNNTTWVNTSHGLPSSITYASATPNAQTTAITYDYWFPRLPHTIASNGLTSSFTYDSSGNMLTRTLTDTTSQSVPYSTNGQTRTWTYTYNGTGQLLTAQLPRTDVTAKTAYTYSGGTLATVTDALGHETAITQAQGGGLPKKIRDPNGIFTTLSYNNRNWMTSSIIATSAGNLTTSYTYDSAGELTKTTLPDNSYLSYAYDNAHRLTTTTNALSETSSITYDSAGGVTQTLLKDASGNTKFKHTATFDALGRMLTSVNGEGDSTSFTYDKNGNTLTITDPRGYATTQTFDSMDRLSTYKNAENDLSSIKYDSHSRPLTVTDGRGNSTTYVYNGFGDTIQQDSPDSLKTIYYYDEDSNVTGENQSGINYSSAAYDALDRLTARTYSGDSSLNTALYYDSSGHGYGVGHLTGGTDATGSFSRSYDERGNITTDAKTIDSNTWSSNYAYDSAGRLSSITYASSGWVIGYGRDAAGQVQYVSATQPGHSAVNLASDIAHMPFGPASSWTYGNGVTDTRTFDKAYRMTSVRDAGTGDIQYLSYGYDASGNITSITDNVTSANDQTLTYDRIDRLASASGVYGTVSSITYDSNSNRLTYGATSYTIPGSSDRMSNAGGSAITYTSTGNVNGIGTDSMTYNQANQMATATVSGTTSTYTYDAFGQRLKLKTPGSVYAVHILNLDGSLQSETHSGTETDYAYFDGIPVSVIQPGAATISALHTDNIATVQRATNASKTIVWTGNYEPFGAVTPTTSITQNQRFLNNYADNTGYYHNGFRDRNPSSTIGGGRFLQVDPLGLAAGTNPYVYVLNNPFRYIDPFGLEGAQGPYPPPPPDIPGGPWTWSPDPNNSRGGTYTDPNGNSASWDAPGNHWDVDNGKCRHRYNRWGKPLDKEDAHNYKGPKQSPLSVIKDIPKAPLIIIIDPCLVSPDLCLPPGVASQTVGQSNPGVGVVINKQK